jgi:hypothetical protein
MTGARSRPRVPASPAVAGAPAPASSWLPDVQRAPTWDATSPLELRPTAVRVLDAHHIAAGNPPRLDRRAVDPEARLALPGDRPQHSAIAIGCSRVDVDDHTALIAAIDTHGRTADADRRAYPGVFRERLTVGRIDEEVGAKAQRL